MTDNPTFKENLDIRIAGDNALIIYFSNSISAAISRQLQQTIALIEASLNPVIVDLIPSYTSLLIVYKSDQISYLKLRNAIAILVQKTTAATFQTGKRLELPVYYSLESGADLKSVAKRHNLTVDDVIAIHSGQDYFVHAIGFAPGFAYLGEVDKRIATPRLDTPRKFVPKGSVAIADQQTAVYPANSPGGWQLLGLCPTPLFTPAAQLPMPVSVGDSIFFKPISKKEFFRLGGKL